MNENDFEGTLVLEQLARIDAVDEFMAAADAFHICQNHPFFDGNKRTALASALVFLELNSVSLDDPEGKLLEAMLNMAKGALNKQQFAKILKEL